MHRSKLPGAGAATPLLVVSRSGVDAGVAGVSALGPDDLIAAWHGGADPAGASAS